MVGTATDGLAGRDLVLETKPDILLSDIRMPRCSGLDMIDAVRSALPDCKVIIITGYDQFQYASRAIKLAVFDYLLKPIDNAEVMNTVRRAGEALRQQREAAYALQQADLIKQRAMLLTLLTNPSHRGQGVSGIFSEMGITFSSYYIMTLQIPNERTFAQAELNRVDGLCAAHGLSCLTLLLYDTVVVFAMPAPDTDWKASCRELLSALRQALPAQLRIGVSTQSTSLHGVRQTYQEARQALWEAALCEEEGCVRFYDESIASHPAAGGASSLNHRIQELIDKATLEDDSAQEAARELIALSGHQYSHLRAMIAMYTLALRNKFAAPSQPDTDAVIYDTWFVTSEEEARACLLKLCATLRAAR